MSQDLVVEGIQEDGPLPVSRSNFKYGHVGDHELKRCSSVPVSSYLIGEYDAFLSSPSITPFSGP